MRVTTDLNPQPADSGLTLLDRALDDENLGANQVTLESDGLLIRFEGIQSGSAMLFREDAVTGTRFVALDAYDKSRIRAMASLFNSDARSMIDSIEWQEDEVSGWNIALIAIVGLVIAIAVFWAYQ
jgi:hypothetical protein